MNLKISAELSLPLEVAGEAIGILATRGAGKSYTSAALVEELWRAKVQLAVLDPTGVYWGLRSSADGRSEGLPITVLGGAHGDVPLEQTAGALIADLLVDTGQSLVLDLSDLPTKGAQTRFVTEFAERLYRRKARARSTLHLIFDEAQEFAPQRAARGEERMLGAMETLVRGGRSRGLGATLITQRSATLNKNVLDLVDTLVAMRIGSPRDRKAVEGWITAKNERDDLGVLDSLPGLPTGTAWIWSPVRGVLQRAPIRRIRTFDSYATPKPGEQRVDPTVQAPIDLTKLGAQIAATAERAKADDPKELRRQIASLRSELSKNAKDPEEDPKEVVRTVEVPVFDEQSYERAKEIVATASSILSAVMDEAEERLHKALDEQLAPLLDHMDRWETAQLAGTLRRPDTRPPAPVPITPPRVRSDHRNPGAIPPRARLMPEPIDGEVSKPQQRILGALGWLESLGRPHADRTQLAFLADASPKSSGYSNNLGAMRSAGLIDYPSGGTVMLTEKGRAIADPVDVPASSAELQAVVFEKVGKAKARILRDLIAVYPDALSREELAAEAGASPTSSGYSNNLGSLRTLGLLDYPSKGWVVATSALFLDGGA